MSNVLTLTAAQQMTSREIAELTGKRHDNVMRVCDDLQTSGVCPQIEVCFVINELANGRKFQEYRLNKRDSLVLVARLSPEFTGRVVDRWMELEAAVPAKVELSRLDLLEIALTSERERLALASQVAEQAPKVAFAEAVRSIDGVCHIEKIAKTLGYGRNKFFKRLRDDAVLMRSNLPYQKYIDRQYFTVIEQEPFTDKDGIKHPTFTAMVTGAGQVFLARKYPPVAVSRNSSGLKGSLQ